MATTAAQNTNSALPSRIRGARLIPHRPAPPNTEELSAKRRPATSNACARFRPDARQSAPPPAEYAFRPRLRAGFTLLELSIVLAIIGLLIGGIFVGQSLIHNAQINAVITEFTRYQSAVRSFQQQYQALSGDMTNATSFWGSAGGTGLSTDQTCSSAVSTTTATCNGNGNGHLDSGGCCYAEMFHFWKQLSNAKMIEGSFTGAQYGVATFTAIPGTNVPASRFGSNVGWMLNYTDPGYNYPVGGLETQFFNADYGNTGQVFYLGYLGTASSPFTPKDAWSIDKKIDDGKPAQGNVIGSETPNCTNAANMNDLDTSYKLTTTSPSCFLIFVAGF